MSYHNLAELETGLTTLQSTYPSTSALIDLPNTTYEGNTVRAIRIGTDAGKPGVLVVAGLHAREWMPPEICLSLAADILEAYDLGTGLGYGSAYYSAAEIRQIVESYTLYFVPTGNPDGFAYSKAHDEIDGSSGWRKNRNPTAPGRGGPCIGVDLNRNYDVLFNYPVHLSPGADTSRLSTDPCEDVFQGPSPQSEQETLNIVWMLDTFTNVRWFFDIHSYSRLILYPWGHDQVQTTDPAQNFLNPSFDGARGVRGDAYAEYIDARDLAIHEALADQIQQGVSAVNGVTYTPQIGFDLYPTTGSSSDYAWSRHLVDPSKQKVFGLAMETGMSFRPVWSTAEGVIAEVSSGLLRFLREAPCLTWPLTVTEPSPLEINFDRVPEGLTTYRAIVFEVTGCRSANLRIVSGPTVTSGPAATVFGTPRGPVSETADPGLDFETPTYARVWISYTGTSDGDVATGTVRVRCDATDQEWDVPIYANTEARPNVAVMLSLDQSGSMDDPAGDLGATRMEVLREAATRFTELVPANSAVGLIRFDHEAYPVTHATYPGLPITHIATDDMADPGRNAARNAAMAHATNPLGYTSIGDGVIMAQGELTPVTGYHEKAMIVFTDGIENEPVSIANALGSTNSRTFAIGLGVETQVSSAGLLALAGVRDGYLLLTGHLTTDTDDYFRLTKYFHQILAGVTRTDIVRDPSGVIAPGTKIRIPFNLTEADVEATAILLSDLPVLRFWLETPAGDKLDPGSASAIGATFAVGTRMAFYRFGLPLSVGDAGARQGTWHAVLEVDEALWDRYDVPKDDVSSGQGSDRHPKGVRFNLSFHSYSNLRMEARLDQSSLEPGALLTLRAALTEYDVPFAGEATVTARIVRPDSSTATLGMAQVEPGVFEVTMTAGPCGIYHVVVAASGKSRGGHHFTREKLFTAAILRGGDTPLPDDKDLGGADQDWCQLVECLLSTPSVRKLLSRNDLDAGEILKCIEVICRPMPTGEGEGARRCKEAAELAKRLTSRKRDIELVDLVRDLQRLLLRDAD